MIDLYGVEYEGSWKGTPGRRPFMDTQIVYDGSVAKVDGIAHFGEVRSDPLPLKDLIPWVVEHIPTHINQTMGTHLHFSLKSSQLYATLMTDSYTRELLKRYKEFNETIGREICGETYNRFAKRLRGQNSYCRKGNNANINAGVGRYTQVNYCWSKHRTVEVRVLPGTTKPEFITGLIYLTHQWTLEFLGKHIQSTPSAYGFRR